MTFSSVQKDNKRKIKELVDAVGILKFSRSQNKKLSPALEWLQLQSTFSLLKKLLKTCTLGKG